MTAPSLPTLRRTLVGTFGGLALTGIMGLVATVGWVANGGHFGRISLTLVEVWLVYLAGGALGGAAMGLLFPITKSARGARVASALGFTIFYASATLSMSPDSLGLVVGVVLGTSIGAAIGPRFMEKVTEDLGPGLRRRYPALDTSDRSSLP